LPHLERKNDYNGLALLQASVCVPLQACPMYCTSPLVACVRACVCVCVCVQCTHRGVRLRDGGNNKMESAHIREREEVLWTYRLS